MVIRCPRRAAKQKYVCDRDCAPPVSAITFSFPSAEIRHDVYPVRRTACPRRRSRRLGSRRPIASPGGRAVVGRRSGHIDHARSIRACRSVAIVFGATAQTGAVTPSPRRRRDRTTSANAVAVMAITNMRSAAAQGEPYSISCRAGRFRRGQPASLDRCLSGRTRYQRRFAGVCRILGETASDDAFERLWRGRAQHGHGLRVAFENRGDQACLARCLRTPSYL